MNAYGLEIEVHSVSQITDRVARLLQADAVLADVWVSGEISNFTHHSSGHMYMTLKDDTSRLRAVMFQGANRGLRFRPESGMRVFAHGYVGVYRSGGEYQLYIDFMEPAGLGGLFLAFQQLKAKLEAEGLFDAALKRPLPRFPKRVAVATSPTGAAIRDIITVARRRWPAVHIIIIPTLVQGDGAPASIVSSIEQANALAEAGNGDGDGMGIDVLIVGRGAGPPRNYGPSTTRWWPERSGRRGFQWCRRWGTRPISPLPTLLPMCALRLRPQLRKSWYPTWACIFGSWKRSARGSKGRCGG